MIADHPMIGKRIDWEDDRRGKVPGIVTGVRYGGLLVNHKTNTARKSLKLRIKPDDGSRAFWTCAVAEA